MTVLVPLTNKQQRAIKKSVQAWWAIVAEEVDIEESWGDVSEITKVRGQSARGSGIR